jgi:cell division protein FtsW (lipid II flippase)
LVLAVQTLLILAGVLRLFPITGITLPFMSYGGTSLVANMLLLAMLARISHGARA